MADMGKGGEGGMEKLDTGDEEKKPDRLELITVMLAEQARKMDEQARDLST